LKELEIFEISSLHNLLKNIDVSNKPNLHRWKDEMHKAIRVGNEEVFKQLINVIGTDNF